MCINARIQNFMKISTPSMAWKKRIVKNEWETSAENHNFDPTDMSKNKIVKIQLVFMMFLAAPKTHVRRIIGIRTPDAPCKSQKFRSRIALSKSSPGQWKMGNHLGFHQKSLDQWQKKASDGQIRNFKSMPRINVVRAKSLPRCRNIKVFVISNVQNRS